MIKIEHLQAHGSTFQAAIRGMRNPMNSWEKSDTEVTYDEFCVGVFDYDLMIRLRNAGTDHRKFMRMITVSMDITAPLYWWKEFDTYKVGTVANSCSTMHKIHANEFTVDDFSCEHLSHENEDASELLDIVGDGTDIIVTPQSWLNVTIALLNNYRLRFLQTKDKKYWWQMIQLLPTSYNQKRTVMLNYEVLANMYEARKNHKLDEWREFCKTIKELPFSLLITNDPKNEEE